VEADPSPSSLKAFVVNFSVIVAALEGDIGAVMFLGRGNAQGAGSSTDASTATAPAECASKDKGARHQLRLSSDAFSQASLTVKRCDTIVIDNEDMLSYDLNFGKHDKHMAYPGYRPSTLAPHKSVTITAVEAGEFELHDHFRDNAELQLTVL